MRGRKGKRGALEAERGTAAREVASAPAERRKERAGDGDRSGEGAA